MDFKEIILDLLIDHSGGSQTNLSRQTGIPIPTINGWLTKDKLPRVQQLITLSRHFNVSVDYLLGLDENPAPATVSPRNVAVGKNNKISEKVKIIKTVNEMDARQTKLLAAVLDLMKSNQ